MATRIRSGRQSGTGTLEYIGAVVGAMVLLLGLVTVFPSASEQITCKLRQVIASISGGDSVGCSASNQSASSGKAPPTRPRLETGSTQSHSSGLSVSVIDVGSGMKLIREDYSDKTVKITTVDTGSAGLSTSSGGIKVNSFKTPKGRLSVQGSLVTSETRVFTDPQQADEYWNYAQKDFDSRSEHFAINFANSLFRDRSAEETYQPPPPTKRTYQGKITGAAEASAELAVLAAKAGGELGMGLEIGYDETTGETTVSTKVSLDGEAAARLGLKVGEVSGTASGPSLSLGMTMEVETTLDAHGDITQIAVSADTGYEGTNLSELFSNLPTLPGEGQTLSTAISFPVNDSNRVQSLAFLVLMAGGESPTSLLAIPWAMDEARANGDMTAQILEVETTNSPPIGFQLELPGAKGLGVDMQSSVSSITVKESFYRTEQGWLPWDN